MKKLLFIFAILIAITFISGLKTGVASAWDSGCNGAGPYSITTGQLCSGTSYSSTTTTTTTIAGCNSYNQYSTITGQYCYGQSGNTYNNNSYVFNRELGYGARGEDVVAYQQLLTNQGYSLGSIDGVFGSATRRATLNYQSPRALPVTGNGDTETLNSLSNSSTYPTYPTQPVCPTKYVNGVLTYLCTNSNITITTTSLPNGYVGSSYSGTISATSSSNSNYTWSIANGSLPPGIYLNQAQCFAYPCQASVYLSGAPTTAGTYTFTVNLSTGTYQYTSRTFTITVTGQNNTGSPTITFISPTSGRVGTLVNIYGNVDPNMEIYFGNYRQSLYSNGDGYIIMRVPEGLSSYCPTGTVCSMQYLQTTPGNYGIYLRKNGLTSNTVNFTVLQ